MLSIHSPDDIFMALVSIFISKTHNHFWSALRIENDTYKLRTNKCFYLNAPEK